VLNFLDGYVSKVLAKFMADVIDENRNSIIASFQDDLIDMGLSSRRRVSSFIEEITYTQPNISQDFLGFAVGAVVNIEKAKNGVELLKVLSNMDTEDVERLSGLLQNWDVEDIVYVMDEIDRRLIMIEAIRKVHLDPHTDELQTLHPLILNSRWLFGPEFDSPHYTYNETLSTIIKKFFKDTDFDTSVVTNLRKRPDILILNSSCLSANCTDRLDSETKLTKPDRILIIELKRGGSEIGRNEMNQAQDYVRQIKKCSDVHRASEITAFVVGCTVGDISSTLKTDDGVVNATSFATLIETASKKLFGLQEKLKTHYDSMGEETLVEKALARGVQVKMDLTKGKPASQKTRTGTEG